MLAPHVRKLEPLTALVENLKQAWRAGEFPDAESALREHPDLLQYRSLVVDLVYEEYCVREEIGDIPEPEGFCQKFPAYRSHIRDVIHGHRLLADHPELVEPTIHWPRPGDSFDQLTIVRELGRGAFARVYLAHEPETGNRPVVVKLAPTRSGEARTLGGISHDHIVTVLWARQTTGFFAVCMPFVGAVTFRDGIESWFQAGAKPRSGRSLLDVVALSGGSQDVPSGASVLTGRESHPEAVAEIAARLADAVCYLHRRGIAHGDLKSSNILLGPGARPYLIDFNLSTGQAGSLLRRGGTLPYMPPEQLRLMLGAVEQGTVMAGDVYSFGVVLFEAMTGRVPFEPGTAGEPAKMAAELLRCQTACGSSPTQRTGIPKPLARLIDRCLDLNPLTRPSIESVKQSLDRYRNRHRGRWFRVAVGGAITLGLTGWLAIPDVKLVSELPSQPAPPAKPVTAAEHFNQGLRYLKAAKVLQAMSEFESAKVLTPNGETSGHLAYTYSLKGYPDAAKEYQQAIKRGFAPAWVRNNLARSLNETGTREHLEEAVKEANAALTSDSNLWQARLNRADARFRLSLSNSESNPVSAESLADIEAVMSQPSDSAGLYYHAASITVWFGCGRKECHAQAVDYLKKAIRLGRDPEKFPTDPALKALGQDIRPLLALKPGIPPASPTNPYLAHPPLE